MYCPRCGEDQTSGRLRFCNRCGLPLELVNDVLSNGGTLPQLEEVLKEKKFFTRKNGMFFGIVWLVFFLLIITPFWAILDVEEMAAFSAVLGLFGSLLIMLFSLFFLGKSSAVPKNQVKIQNQQMAHQHLTGNQSSQHALPPRQEQFARDFVAPAAMSWKAPDTGDLVQPGSVTEGTTKLLQREDQN